MILPDVTVERKLTYDGKPYVIVTAAGRGYNDDRVAVFSGPDAEKLAWAFSAAVYNHRKEDNT